MISAATSGNDPQLCELQSGRPRFEKSENGRGNRPTIDESADPTQIHDVGEVRERQKKAPLGLK